MKKIVFDVSDELCEKIDQTILKGDFMSRAEFLRFLIFTYYRENPPHSVKKGVAWESKKNEPKSLLDEFPGASLEFGIPEVIIKRLKEKCGIK